MRWRMEMSEYDFEIEHISGKENILADFLSRQNEERVSVKSVQISIPDLKERIVKSQSEYLSRNDEMFEEEGYLLNEDGRIIIPEEDKELKLYVTRVVHKHPLG
ncbi:hypothetical protein ADUPG1_006111, partial [Aduncisulcus paluster]